MKRQITNNSVGVASDWNLTIIKKMYTYSVIKMTQFEIEPKKPVSLEVL